MRAGAKSSRRIRRRRDSVASRGQPLGAAPSLLDALARSQALPPHLSARERLSRWQWEMLGGLIVAVLAGLIFFLDWTMIAAQVAFWLLFSMTVFWRLALTIIGVLEKLKADSRKDRLPPFDAETPVYSVLVALRHEAGMMDQLARQLRALDWPAEQLEILLLVEADDEATRQAIAKADFPARTRCLTVPPGAPMTKPRALNYGLAHASGEFVTVYDAEDRPHPDQLKLAARRFAQARPGLVCVQAPLICTNGGSGWIAAHWSLEYAVQFGLHMPAMTSLDLPIMLGGTSNHFKRLDLIAMGGWDAWNVTEDADIGLRIARLGGRTETIRAGTAESAPMQLRIWLNQRSRWIKGFMQTWLVCMRSPVSLMLELGPLRWLSLQLTLGGAIVSAFLYGPMSLMILAGTALPQFSYGAVDIVLFAAGCAGCALADILAPGGWSLSRIIAIVTRPLYWPLQTLAGLKALGGLALSPSFWPKTPHKPDEPENVPPWQSGSSPPS